MPQFNILKFASILLLLTSTTVAAPAKSATSSAKASVSTGTSGGKATSIDLSNFSLQLPVGTTGHPNSISSANLKTYTNPSYFFTNSAGELIMDVPGSPASSGCVTTANSLHCRTELEESSPANWSPTAATNSLKVTLTAIKVDTSKYGTVIGQIHMEESVSVRPVCELYYNQSGDLTMGVEQTRAGGDEVYTVVGNVPVGTQFSYEITYQGGALAVAVNGGTAKTLSTYSLDNPASYFKVGNYNQGSSPSSIEFSSISITH